MATPKQIETGPSGVVTPLGPHWNAILMADGSVLIQHNSIVTMDGNWYKLSEPQDQEAMKVQNPTADRIMSRALLLTREGSIWADPEAVSIGGIPGQTGELFQLLDSVDIGAARRMKALNMARRTKS